MIRLIRYHTIAWIYKLGISGWIGIAALIAAVIGYVNFLHPAIHARDQAKLDLIAYDNAPTKVIEVKTPSFDDDIKLFIDTFPETSARQESIKQVLEAAEHQGLIFENAKYETLTDQQIGLLGYQISFPLKGNFLQIEKFLAEVTQSIPTSTINSLNFRRASVDDPNVEANIALVIYTRAIK